MNNKFTYGVGFNGPGKYTPTENGQKTRAYSAWHGMMGRCYDTNNVAYERYGGVGIKVSEFWHNFQDFAGWCSQEFGFLEVDSRGRRWVLDKDIIEIGNKVYSPATCCFVPDIVNKAIIFGNSSNRTNPLGVYWKTNQQKFAAQCRVNGSDPKHLGHYDCPMEAHRAWQQYKAKAILELITLYPLGDSAKNGLISLSNTIFNDFNSGIETKL